MDPLLVSEHRLSSQGPYARNYSGQGDEGGRVKVEPGGGGDIDGGGIEGPPSCGET